MRRYQTFLVIAEAPRAAGNVVPLSMARIQAPSRAADGPQARETSWRDLVRRLAKNLAKR